MDTHSVQLTANASGIVKAFQDISRGAATAAASMTKVGTAGSTNLGKATSAAKALDGAIQGVAGAQLITFLGDSARAAADAEASMARLAQAFENAGTSVDEHAQRLEAAGQAALAMAYDDEEAADAIASITATTGDASGAIDLLAVSMDLARAKGISLAQASTIVGKVAAGNTDMLKRYGIVLDDNATSTEALAAIQQKFGGQAEAYANTQRGAIDRLAVSWGNFQEQVGGVAGPLQAVLGVLPGVSAAMGGLSGALIKMTGKSGFAGVAAAINPVTAGLGAAGLAAGALILAWNDMERSNAAVAQSFKDVNAALLDVADTQAIAAFQELQATADEISGLKIADSFRFYNSGDEIANFNSELARTIDIVQATDGDLGQLRATVAGLDAAWKAGTTSLESNKKVLADLGTVTEQGTADAQAAVATLTAEFLAGRLAPDQYAGGVAKWASNVTTAGNAANAATADVKGFTQAQKEAAAATLAAANAAGQGYGTEGLSSLYPSPSEMAQNRAGLEAASAAHREQADAVQQEADAFFEAAKAQASYNSAAAAYAPNASPLIAAPDHTALDQASAARATARVAETEAAGQAVVDAVERAGDQAVQAAQESADGIIDAANRAADGAIEEAERAGAAMARAINQDYRVDVRAETTAGREAINAAEKTERAVVASAEEQYSRTVEAAQAAEEAMVEAAQSAGEAMVSAAEKSASAQVKAVEQAGRANVRSTQMWAHDQTRAADLAATRAGRAADALEERAKEGAEAQRDATIKAAQAAHDAAVEAADDRADKEIAAAKRSTEKQLIELERREMAQGRKITEEANRKLEEANDAAARAIRGGADPGKVTGDLMRAQENAIDEQVRAQERLVVRQEEAQNRIARQEEQRIEAAEAKREAAQEAAAERLAGIQEAASEKAAAISEAAAKEAEQMRVSAAREASQIERATSRVVTDAQREAARDSARIQREAAKGVEAARESAAAGVDAARETGSANTEAATEQAEKERTKAIREAAQERMAVEREHDRNLRDLDQRRQQDLRANERATTRTVKDENTERENAIKAANATVKTTADDAKQAVLDMQAAVEGAHPEIDFSFSENASTVMAKVDKYFGEDAAQLTTTGVVTIKADWTQYDEEAAERGIVKGTGTATPKTAPATAPARTSTARLHGGVIGYANGGVLPASNGRTVLVGENGRELVTLPVGSRVTPNPATNAMLGAGGGGITITITGPVYGMDDFESKVGEAAARAFSRVLPQAIGDRRRALGAL